MSAEVTGALINGLIGVALGIWVTLLGHGLAGKKPGQDLAYDQKMEKIRPIAKVLGPIIIVGGVAFFVVRLLQVT